MSPINPIRGPANIPGSVRAKGASQSEVTAAKVSQIKLPFIDQKSGLGGRQIALLDDAKDLFKKINKGWNSLAPEELADKIIELENKVSLFKESSPEIEKIKRLTEHLHFKFVFPVALELDVAAPDKSMPVSFARSIYNAANQVFKTHSAAAFNQLNQIQKQEVLRIAARGQS